MKIEYLGRFDERPRNATFQFWSPTIGDIYAKLIRELVKTKHPDVSVRELEPMAREILRVVYSESDVSGPLYRYFRLVR